MYILNLTYIYFTYLPTLNLQVQITLISEITRLKTFKKIIFLYFTAAPRQSWYMYIIRLGYHASKAVGPMYIGRVIPEHVKDPRAPVDKSRALIPGVSGQIPELLRIAVKLHRHHYR